VEREEEPMKRFISIGALVAALALVTASGFVVPTARADGVIPLHNATAPAGTDCPAGGAAYWHFVLAPNGGGYSFTSITLAFGDGTSATVTGSAIIPNKAQTDNVFVAVPAGRALTDLVTTGSSAAYIGAGTPNQFNLSHVCPGTVPPTTPPTTEPPTTPPTTEPPTTLPTTEPATTEPATTEPATTEPAKTEPATTEPATTAETTIPGSVFPPTTPPTTVAPTTPTTGVPSVTTTTVAGQTAGPTTTAAALPTTGGTGTTTAIGAALALAAGAVMTLTARRRI
jgi:hypothetical protein